MAIEQSATRTAKANANEMRAIVGQNLLTTDASIATFIAPKVTVTVPSKTSASGIIGHTTWVRFTPTNQQVVPACACWVNVKQQPAYVESWESTLVSYFKPVQIEPGLFEIRTLYNQGMDDRDYILEVMVSSLVPGRITVTDKGDYTDGK